MKKMLVFLALLLFQQAFAQVSPHPYRGTISTAGADCSTSTNCVSVTIPPETASATISVDATSGSWSGTIQFEGTMDGSHWIAMVPTSNSSSASSSTTSTGTWQFNPSSYIQIRARGSARVSGTAPIVINWSNATASNGGGGFSCFGGNCTIPGTLGVTGNTTIGGTLSVGPGLPADATVVVSKEAAWDATNHVLTLCAAAPCDTIIKAQANTADGTGTGGCGGGGTAGAGKQCAWRAGGSGVTVTVSAGTNTEGFMASQNTSGTVDAVGSWTTAIAAGKKIAGQLASAPGGAGGTALMLLFPWSIGTTNEHVISFNLIKSGAVGVFPRVKGYSCTIYSVDVTADQSGTFAMDIWKVATAIPAAGNKISNVDGPALTAAQSSFDHVPSGWSSLAVSDGDVFGGTVGTFTTVTNVLVQIRCH